MGVVYNDNSQFYFALGDITVDGKAIQFPEMTDTTKIGNAEQFQKFITTKPFTLNNNSQFEYSVQYGVTDSVEAATTLGENKSVRFKIELLDDATGQVIGVYDDVTYTASHVEKYNNVGYEVGTEGIGAKTVRLRLVITNSINANYSLSDKHATDVCLGKKGSVKKQRNFKGSLVVTEYALEQNYPNPFNPTTTINYQIPKDGSVTITVFDNLGREVATLVNEQKEAGRYSVQFDATRLSSGVYYYSLKAGDYKAVKKLVLLK